MCNSELDVFVVEDTGKIGKTWLGSEDSVVVILIYQYQFSDFYDWKWSCFVGNTYDGTEDQQLVLKCSRRGLCTLYFYFSVTFS